MYIIVVGGVVVIDINLQYILSLTTCTYRTHVILCVLYLGCISLTIQGKRDLKALSSEKMMKNKCIDYSHIIRKISFGWENIDD